MVLILLGDETVHPTTFRAADLAARLVGNAYVVLNDRYGNCGRRVSAAELHEMIGHRASIRDSIRRRGEPCQTDPSSPTPASSSGT